MLELLEPYAGQRARVVLLIELAGPRARAARAADGATLDLGDLGAATFSVANQDLNRTPTQAPRGG